MILVGLTGGVATGKTTVAKMFKRHGAVVVDADVLARQVVEPDKPAWREIVRTFGPHILNADRTLNRHALGQLVFGNRAKLRRLEHIIHPRVARLQAKLTRAAAKKNPKAVAIYDVPLLFEAGVDKRMDKIIVVTADETTQIRRLRNRSYLSRAQALCRINSQMPIGKKIKLADYLIDGTLPLSQVRKQVGQLYRELKGISCKDRLSRQLD
jgi:dephospho-CoA kinase